MTIVDVFEAVVRLNLAAGAAILAVLLTRRLARPLFGPGVSYALWLLVPAAAAASLIPAKRQVLHYVLPLQAQLDPTALAAAPAMAPDGPPPMDYRPLVVALWIAGFVLTAALLFWRQRRFLISAGRLDQTAEPDMARSNAAGVGPAVIGAVSPRIVVPADFDARFDADERALVLAHERAHLARQDARINALVAAIQCAFWFNPLVHLAARALRMDQELACDAAVIAQFPEARRRYAEAMLKTQLTATPLPFGCYWPPSSVEPLKERIAMLKLKSPSLTRKLIGGAAVVALTAGAGFTAWAAKPAHVVVETEIAAAPAVGPVGAGDAVPAVESLTATPALPAVQPPVSPEHLATALTLAAADPAPPAPPAPPAAPAAPTPPPAPPAPRAARPPAPPAPPAPPRVMAMHGDMKVRCKVGAAGKVESCSMPAMGAPNAGEIDVPFTPPDVSGVTAQALRQSELALRQSEKARRIAVEIGGRPPVVIDTRAIADLARQQGELERRAAELQSHGAANAEVAAARAAADANRAQLDAEARRIADDAAKLGANVRIRGVAPPAPSTPPPAPAAPAPPARP